jgi:hypothetical protein
MNLDWLNSYQTLLVGGIGFAGVIVTLLVNAKISRDQRRHEIEHERATLRAALVAELKVNGDSLRGNLASLEKLPTNGQKGAFVPTDPMDDAFRSFVPRLGLLTELEVHKVMTAYLYLRTYTARLFLIGVPPQTGPRHVQVPPENLERLKAEMKAAVPIIEQAREALERASGET